MAHLPLSFSYPQILSIAGRSWQVLLTGCRVLGAASEPHHLHLDPTPKTLGPADQRVSSQAVERREADRCEAAERKAAAAAEKAERRASVKAAAAGARAATKAAAAEAAYASDSGKSARRCESLAGQKFSSRVVTSGSTHAVQDFAVVFTGVK